MGKKDELVGFSIKKTEELKRLMRDTGKITEEELLNHALSFLAWGVKQRQAGRVIISMDEKTKGYKILEFPVFPIEIREK